MITCFNDDEDPSRRIEDLMVHSFEQTAIRSKFSEGLKGRIITDSSENEV